MAESHPCFVHTQGDINDVLFQLPPSSRRLDEGDELTVTLVGGSAVTYKVEEVTYKLLELASGNPSHEHNYWSKAEVYYGVSIVP